MKHLARTLCLLAAGFMASSVLADGVRYVPAWGVTGAQLGASAFFTATGVTLDPSGNVLIVGNGGNGASPIALVAKISPAGSVLWYQSITQPGALGTSANAVACDSAGAVYVAGGLATSTSGEVIVAKFDASGTALWTITTSGGGPGGLSTGVGGTAIAVDSTGVYVGGAWGNPVQTDWLAKIALSGGWAGSWVKQVVGSTGWTVTSLALDGSSNVYASLKNGSAPPFAQGPGAWAFTTAGTQLWWTSTNTAWNYTDCGARPMSGNAGTISRVRLASDGTLWAFTSANNVFVLNASSGVIVKGTAVDVDGTSTLTPLNDFAFWPSGPSGLAVFCGSSAVLGRSAWAATTGSSSCLGPNDGWLTKDFSMVASTFHPVAVAAGANGDVYAVGSGNVGVVALRDVLAAPNTVKAGTLEIRNNIISSDTRLTTAGMVTKSYESTAYIFVRAGTGATDKNVKVSVFGPSGRFMGALTGITIGADGTGSVAFNGVVEGKRLSTGMYYIVVTGAGIKDRKPIMILGKKDL
jgi:hypothetical protein